MVEYTLDELVEMLDFQIHTCELTKTTLAHISLQAAREIRARLRALMVLEERERED